MVRRGVGLAVGCCSACDTVEASWAIIITVE